MATKSATAEEKHRDALVWTVLIGFVAKMITPGKGPSEFIMTAILSVAGSVLASFLGQAVDWYGPGHIPGLGGSVIGAVVLLVAYHLFTRNSGNDKQ